jgi:hypothetical protein
MLSINNSHCNKNYLSRNGNLPNFMIRKELALSWRIKIYTLENF